MRFQLQISATRRHVLVLEFVAIMSHISYACVTFRRAGLLFIDLFSHPFLSSPRAVTGIAEG